MQSGKLRFRVDLQSYTDTVNEDREPIKTWASLGNRWASILATSGKEYEQADKNNAISTHRIRLRSDSVTRTLTPKMRITHSANVFNINYITPDRTDRRFLLAFCTVNVDNGVTT